METITVLFATSDPGEKEAFAAYVQEHGLSMQVLFPDSVFRIEELLRTHDLSIIVTDLSFQQGGLADWHFLWPSPFILLADSADAERIDAVVKDESSSFVIREPDYRHVSVLAIMIRKVINFRESISRHNLHLQISERRYLDLVQTLPDIVYMLDTEGYFSFINDSVRSLGWDPCELIGKHFTTILDPADAPLVSRRIVLEQYKGRQTGAQDAPKLFDERRGGERKTCGLEIRLRRKEASSADKVFGSIITCGEVSSAGFGRAEPGTVGIIRDMTQRREAERLIRKSLQEKETLLKEVHHRVKNNLQIVSSLLSLQLPHIKAEEDERIFRSFQMQVRAIALVHEQLHRCEMLSTIGMRRYVEVLCAKIMETYRRGEGEFELVCAVDDITIDIETAMPVALLINELVSNSMKHAFPDGRPGCVTVSLKNAGPHRCTLTVVDDGVGLPDDFNQDGGRSLGMNLVQSLVRQLDGSLAFETGEGSTFRIEFPLKSHG